MASANGSPECSAAVPQWKRDLIQRRRQQNKVLTSNGATGKLCSAVTGNFGNNADSEASEPVPDESARIRTPDCIDSCSERSSCAIGSSRVHPPCGATSDDRDAADGEATNYAKIGSNGQSRVQPTCGATSDDRHAADGEATNYAKIGSNGQSRVQPTCGATSDDRHAADGEETNYARIGSNGQSRVSPVVCNMRLEADASSLCPSSEDAPNFNARNNQQSAVGVEFENYENEESLRNYTNRARKEMDVEQDNRSRAARIIKRIDKDSVFDRKNRCESAEKMRGNGRGDECESDSSEELQYGPGIVNRLKSKYLNLTLRETGESRVGVQRFRRAASLEDLLDHEEEAEEKTARKFAKRSSPGVAPKTDRYRNSTRGNESMKRARSVETLVRYNSPLVAEESIRVSRFVTTRQEPVNDHIVLIDRTTVKIESRLVDTDRPKAINKPKRIKPLLAETERPPTDLVKTTMRIFEGSVKKFKPKGDVAVKVATFKTINDTYKAQAMKKVAPKPPVQPKPSFVNGNSKPGSPKKILPPIPTAELIEKPEVLEEYRNDGVVTDPIVQSVSSVVSKFRQIEKSQSPEPTYKLRFSPAPSPEPPLASKLKASNESLVKSPPVTPAPSPRIASPASPKRQNSSPVQQPPSPSRELFRQASLPETARNSTSIEDTEAKETEAIEDSRLLEESEANLRDESKCNVEDGENVERENGDENEAVDGSRTITKLALDNISKAGSTVQFNFGDKTSVDKSYLPGAATQNGRKTEAVEAPNGVNEAAKSSTELKVVSPGTENCSSPVKIMETEEEVTRLEVETKISRSPSPSANLTEYTKPIGAISSLALIKSSSTTTTTSYPQSNESKTIRSPKSDITPPQKQIGIIRPLVSTKTQIPQQNLSNRELEKNHINRVKSIEQPTKVVVSLKSADEIQPVKKTTSSPGNGGGGGGGLWDTKPWNQANNTMVFNFSNRKDVPDYIENDGLIIRRKREKPKVGDGGVIVLDATLDASTTDDSDWEISGGPPSPCDVSFTNDNILINGRSNLSKHPRNHKHRIQFDDGATRTFEYPSEASMLEDEGTSVDGDASSTGQQSSQGANKSSSTSSASTMSSALLGGGGLASFTPSKVDLASEGFELGVTRTAAPTSAPAAEETQSEDTEEYLKSAQDAAAWGDETTADLLY